MYRKKLLFSTSSGMKVFIFFSLSRFHFGNDHFAFLMDIGVVCMLPSHMSLAILKEKREEEKLLEKIEKMIDNA